MAKADPIDRRLADLTALAKSSEPEQLIEALRRALTDKNNLIIARAALIAGEKNLAQLVPDLAASFHRLMDKEDKGCTGSTAIIKALYEIGAAEEAVFIQGVQHVQMEATWGGKSDVAAELRGWSAMGLVRMASRRATEMIVPLLVDPEFQARVMGIRAAAYSGKDELMWLLRLKALMGDREIDATAECLSGLMRGWPRQCAEFVGSFIDRSDDLRQGALAALSESRSREAFAVLKNAFDERLDPNFRREIMEAMANLRREEAMDFLIGIIREGSAGTARDAIHALKAYRADQAIAARVKEAAAGHENLTIGDAVREIFG